MTQRSSAGVNAQLLEGCIRLVHLLVVQQDRCHHGTGILSKWLSRFVSIVRRGFPSIHIHIYLYMAITSWISVLFVHSL